MEPSGFLGVEGGPGPGEALAGGQLAPAFHPGGEIALIAHAGNI